MSLNARLYDKQVLQGSAKQNKVAPTSRTYKGFSTVSNDSNSFALYDFALIKQDIVNHFNTRLGERLENPTFGTIIWDMVFEPLTETTKRLVLKNVEDIVNYDPRVVAKNVLVHAYEHGLLVEFTLNYLPYNISEQLQFRFDQSNNLLAR